MSRDREVRQLWDAAEGYFRAAKEKVRSVRPYLKYTPGDIVKFYDRKRRRKKHEKELNMLLAHLSSAAVRLFTIEECGIRVTENYLGKGYSKDDLVNRRDEFIHRLLRDNVGHYEKGGKPDWSARQEALESLTIREIVRSMARIMKRFKNELSGRAII